MCFFVASGRRHTRRPRDWSSEVCSSDLKSRHIQELIAMTGGSLVKNVQVFDVYTGDDLPAQKKSIAYRIYFQDEAKTLKEIGRASCRGREESTGAAGLGSSNRRKRKSNE